MHVSCAPSLLIPTNLLTIFQDHGDVDAGAALSVASSAVGPPGSALAARTTRMGTQIGQEAAGKLC
jgi:hypothetical protein